MKMPDFDESIDSRIVRQCSHCNKPRLFEKKYESKRFVVCEDCKRKRSIRRRIFK